MVSSGAGGRWDQFADEGGQTSAESGFWRGYSIVHLDPSGDPAKTVVEQRPVFDWIGVRGDRHVLRPGQSVDIEGRGREPLASPYPVNEIGSGRFDSLDTPAITHCYDLVLADPDRPWQPLRAADASGEQLAAARSETGCKARLPLADPDAPATPAGKSNPCDPYVCVLSAAGTIDDTTGEVKAGAGDQGRVFAVALLSAGSRVATYPLVFEPRPSFRTPPAPTPTPVTPPAAPPAPSPPPAPAPPFNPPTFASPPPIAPPPVQGTLAPPAPPAPPPGGIAQLDLFTSPPTLSVPPLVGIFPPAPPVINVAPPTAARPAEKARKFAVQSSGSEGDGKSEAQISGGDMADGPPQNANAATRNENNFTALAHRDQASAWARDLQWGGGLALMALVLAFGWITVRPTPRRRTPEVPAPAWSRRRGR